MEITAPDFTHVLNLLIAIAGFGAVVWTLFKGYRKGQLKDMTAIVREEIAPLKATAEVALNMAEKHEGILYGITHPEDGLIAKVAYLQGRADERREHEEKAGV